MDFGLTSTNFSDNEKSIKFQWIRLVREGISSRVRPTTVDLSWNYSPEPLLSGIIKYLIVKHLTIWLVGGIRPYVIMEVR